MTKSVSTTTNPTNQIINVSKVFIGGESANSVDAINAISKELERANDRLTNVNHEFLSDIERQENSDSIAKLSFFTRKNMKQLAW